MLSTDAPSEGNISKGPAVIVAICVVVAVKLIAVLLRCSVRVWITKNIWWDDWTIVLAMIGNLIGVGLDFVEVHYGFGRPDQYLTKWQTIEYRKYTFGEWIQTFATLMWTKISICLFLMRIPANKALIRPLQGAVVFSASSNIILTILWIVQCRPVAKAWHDDIDGSCFSKGQQERIIISQASNVTSSSSNVILVLWVTIRLAKPIIVISAVSDFVFSSYPILILWKVQMKLKIKIALCCSLCCLMGVGIFTGVCCIVRTVLNSQTVPKDYTYGGIDNWFWRLFEVNLGIIAACTPALRPGYTWIVDRVKTRYSSKGHAQLTDEVQLRPRNFTAPDYEVDARKSSEVFEPRTELGSVGVVSPHHIKKTVQVDLSTVPKI